MYASFICWTGLEILLFDVLWSINIFMPRADGALRRTNTNTHTHIHDTHIRLMCLCVWVASYSPNPFNKNANILSFLLSYYFFACIYAARVESFFRSAGPGYVFGTIVKPLYMEKRVDCPTKTERQSPSHTILSAEGLRISLLRYCVSPRRPLIHTRESEKILTEV